MIAIIARDPQVGGVISGTCGARKLSIADKSRAMGKSGAYCVVTHYAAEDVPVFALTLIDKGKRANISQAEKNTLPQIHGGLADALPRGNPQQDPSAENLSFTTQAYPRTRHFEVNSMSSLGSRLVQSATEALGISRGEADPATYRIYVPSDVDVRAIRLGQKLTQAEFATRYGFPLGTLRDLEQRRAKPDASTRAYLLVIAREPQAVQRALDHDHITRAYELEDA